MFRSTSVSRFWNTYRSTEARQYGRKTIFFLLLEVPGTQEVKRYGDQAVKVLATYVNSTQGIEQHISLRFLLEFHSDLALTAVRALAEKSAFGGIRQEAITALKGFPPEKVKQIVEHISNNDPDPDVRAHARRIFATFPTSKEVNQK